MKQTILITGASRGIGRAIAKRFMTTDYNLVLTCHTNIMLLEELKEEAKEKGVECLIFQGDIGNLDNVKMLFSQIAATFDGVDLLVNNAGMSSIQLINDMTFEDWNTIVQTNLSSTFYCSKLAAESMLKKHAGKIINISSVWGVVGASMEVAYSTTKGGINAMTKALAKELAPSNVQVNAIACGAIDTDMNRCFSEEDMQYLIDEIPANRLGAPEDVADFVYQLSTANSYLTGQVIQFDGGWI
ncbi:MAG: SDR family NAD(P)-dependent oxidoreductase [bacterium]|nr:SDR family NAD(P)-dependent oxidoreductase [bacterium]